MNLQLGGTRGVMFMPRTGRWPLLLRDWQREIDGPARNGLKIREIIAAGRGEKGKISGHQPKGPRLGEDGRTAWSRHRELQVAAQPELRALQTLPRP